MHEGVSASVFFFIICKSL